MYYTRYLIHFEQSVLIYLLILVILVYLEQSVPIYCLTLVILINNKSTMAKQTCLTIAESNILLIYCLMLIILTHMYKVY